MASFTTSYDSTVVNAMMEVKTKVSELACELCGVGTKENLPKEVQGIDVVKFAEMSPSAISASLTEVLSKHAPSSSQSKISPIVEEVCAAVDAAKAKHVAVWPPSSGVGPSSPTGNKKTIFDAPAEETDSANKNKFLTGKYDFKVMRRLTAIENKFLDALCGYYNVDDEDELPTEVQEISLGEMFEAEKSAAEIKAKMEEQLQLKPWEGMSADDLASVVSEVTAVLEPLMESAKAAKEARAAT